MSFDRHNVKFTDLMISITFDQFGYLKRCLDGLKDMNLDVFNKEILDEGASLLILGLNFEEGNPFDEEQSAKVFDAIRGESQEEFIGIENFALFCEEGEKILLQEEMEGEQIEAGELEINVGVGYFD